MADNASCTLEVVTDGKSRTITLDDKVVTFGRSRKNTVSLREDGKVSAEHCQVVRQKDAWMLIDNGSKNKTFLNGSAVSVAALKHGDVFKIGETTVSFKVGAPQALDPRDAEKMLAAKPSSNQAAGDAIAAALAQPAPESRASRKSSGLRDAVKVERGGKGASMIATACFFIAGILSGLTLLVCFDNRNDKAAKSVAKAEQKAKALVQEVKGVVAPAADEVKNASQQGTADLKSRLDDLRQAIAKSSEKEAVLKSLNELRTALGNTKDLEPIRGDFEDLKKSVQGLEGDTAWLKGEFEALRKTYFDKQEVAVAPKDPPAVVPPTDPKATPPVDPVKPPGGDAPVAVKEPVVPPPPASDEPVAVKPTPPPADPKATPPADPKATPPADPKGTDPGTTAETPDDPNRPPTQFMGLKTSLKRVIFVMDVTGSMEDPASVTPAEFSGPSEVKIGPELKRQLEKFDRKEVKTKLDAAKYELTHSIAYLHPDVEFTVIFYSFSPTPWQRRFMQASEKNKIDAIKRIKTTSAWGGTNIFDALECGFQIIDEYRKTMKKPAVAPPKDPKTAPKGKPDFAIFLVTDGKHNTGRFPDPEDFLKEIRKINADDRALINTIGVGQPGVGVDPPDPVFLARLASENGGESKMLK